MTASPEHATKELERLLQDTQIARNEISEQRALLNELRKQSGIAQFEKSCDSVREQLFRFSNPHPWDINQPSESNVEALKNLLTQMEMISKQPKNVFHEVKRLEKEIGCRQSVVNGNEAMIGLAERLLNK